MSVAECQTDIAFTGIHRLGTREKISELNSKMRISSKFEDFNFINQSGIDYKKKGNGYKGNGEFVSIKMWIGFGWFLPKIDKLRKQGSKRSQYKIIRMEK